MSTVSPRGGARTTGASDELRQRPAASPPPRKPPAVEQTGHSLSFLRPNGLMGGPGDVGTYWLR